MENERSPRYQKENERIEQMPHSMDRGIACLNNVMAEIMGVRYVRRTKRKRISRKLSAQEKIDRKQRMLDKKWVIALQKNPTFSDYDYMQLSYLGRYMRDEIPEEQWIKVMQQTTGNPNWGIP